MTVTDHAHQGPADYRHDHVVAETTDDAAVAIASIHAMGSGTLADFHALYTVDAVNREAQTEPPDTRGTGPAALYATARWLRTAFSELTWTVHDVAHDNDLVVVHATMSGRQTGRSSPTSPTPRSLQCSRRAAGPSRSPKRTGSA